MISLNDASSDALEASIVVFANAQEGDVPCHPLCSLKTKDWEIGSPLGFEKCFPFPSPCKSRVPMSASSGALEASIAVFAISQEGDVTLPPSLLVKNKRLATT